MQMDTDKFPEREDALLYLEERGKTNDGTKQKEPEEDKPASPLLEALTKPV